MIFRFVSEQAAVDFSRFMEDEYELEVEIGSYLCVFVPSEDFDDEDALSKLHEEAERHGADVLL